MDKFIDPSSRCLLTFRTVQLAGVSVASDSQLVTVPQYNKTVEIIGDSYVPFSPHQSHN